MRRSRRFWANQPFNLRQGSLDGQALSMGFFVLLCCILVVPCLNASPSAGTARHWDVHKLCFARLRKLTINLQCIGRTSGSAVGIQAHQHLDNL